MFLYVGNVNDVVGYLGDFLVPFTSDGNHRAFAGFDLFEVAHHFWIDRAAGNHEHAGGLFVDESNRAVLDEGNAFDGVTVTRVVENSPGEAAGVKVGDVILRANGVDLTDPNQLLDMAETLPVGTLLRLRVDRDRQVLILEATTVARHAVAGNKLDAGAPTWIEQRSLGLEFTAADPEQNRRLGIAPRQGIRILRLARRGPLSEAGFQEGMVIVEVDGTAIHSPEGFLDYVESRAAAKTIRLRFVREGERPREKKVRLRRAGRRMRRIRLPPLFSYAREENEASFSLLLGLFSRRRIESAIKYRILWLFTFETGEEGELLEIEPSRGRRRGPDAP